MKKIAVVVLLIGGLALIANLVFSADYFTEVPEKIEYQLYERDAEEYGEAVTLEDAEEISRLIEALNEAEHENVEYETASPADYEVHLFYEDGTTDRIGIWMNWTDEYDLFQSVLKEGAFKLENEEARDVLRETLDWRKPENIEA